MTNREIFNFGKNMVDTVAREIFKSARKESLGTVVEEHGAAGHEVLLADEISERIIRAAVKQCTKECSAERFVTISEGSGIVEYGDKDAEDGIFMIIDPIDGTNNNVRPWKTPAPATCVSIALGSIKDALKMPHLQSVRVGVVKDIFGKGMIWAIKGEGAEHEDYGKISTSTIDNLEEAVLGVDLDDKKNFDEVLKSVAPLMKQTKCQRRIGSSILDMWRVATGEYDAYITISGRMKIYDIAAVKLIIEEAGGEFEEQLKGEVIDNLLKELLETKSLNCLKTCKFNVITSGNKILHDKIKGELPQINL